MQTYLHTYIQSIPLEFRMPSTISTKIISMWIYAFFPRISFFSFSDHCSSSTMKRALGCLKFQLKKKHNLLKIQIIERKKDYKVQLSVSLFLHCFKSELNLCDAYRICYKYITKYLILPGAP